MVIYKIELVMSENVPSINSINSNKWSEKSEEKYEAALRRRYFFRSL